MQLQVLNSPFNQEQADLLNQLLPTLTESQKLWLSGYLAAIRSSGGLKALEPTGEDQDQKAAKVVTILYGSQTGNARGLAEKTGDTLKTNGFQVEISSMSEFKPNQLKSIQNLLVIVSTHGEGNPPDNALTFHEFLHSKRAPKLDKLNFSVLSLGDSSYEFFCQTGKDFDFRLEELGGTRLYPRFDCDVDFEEAAAEWLEGVLGSFGSMKSENTIIAPSGAIQTVTTTYSRTNPFKAEVLENINLNGRGSDKETRHIELSLEGSGLSYEPGDALGIYPENDPELVQMLLTELPWDPKEKVTIPKSGEVLSIEEALTTRFEITVFTKSLLEKVAKLSGKKELRNLLAVGNEEKVKKYLAGRDLLDFVRDYGHWGESSEEFVSVLRKIPSRLYSIASSILANPDEVHLTIGAVRYQSNERERKGVASCFCAERIKPGDKISIYIQKNENFKLPSNPDTSIIMVGPGTGVAPFRSFMQERDEVGAKGKSWMFFGDQHFRTDFLYQIEWQKWLKTGVLTKMDVAFSRDTDRKIYVQNRMLENSKELFKWLEEGAFLYVCGDEKNMARDVHQTLLEIIEKEGHFSKEDAVQYLNKLGKENRYQRDVY